jgi:hypothetical protein
MIRANDYARSCTLELSFTDQGDTVRTVPGTFGYGQWTEHALAAKDREGHATTD